MKKFLVEELSREIEPKRRAPDVIGRLMGLDRLLLQLLANNHHKHLSENKMKGTTPTVKNRSTRQHHCLPLPNILFPISKS